MIKTIQDKTQKELHKLVTYVEQNRFCVDTKVATNVNELKTTATDIIVNLPILIKKTSGKWIVK